MPENPEPAAETVTPPVEADPEGGGSESPADAAVSAPEADDRRPGDDDKPFDRKQAEAKIRKANSEAANLRKRLKELEPLAQKAQEYEDSRKSEAERLNDQLARATEQAAAMSRRAVRAEVRALAAGRFADPDDAAGALDLASYVSGDGEIDTAAIEADLEALLERKPHWAKTAPVPEGPRRPAPDRTQASGANKTKPANPNEEFAGFITKRLLGRG